MGLRCRRVRGRAALAPQRPQRGQVGPGRHPSLVGGCAGRPRSLLPLLLRVEAVRAAEGCTPHVAQQGTACVRFKEAGGPLHGAAYLEPPRGHFCNAPLITWPHPVLACADDVTAQSTVCCSAPQASMCLTCITAGGVQLWTSPTESVVPETLRSFIVNAHDVP